MRGQAFIVFETPQTSTAAKRGLSGFSFYGKELVIDYATEGKVKLCCEESWERKLYRRWTSKEASLL